jgi:hypothetical protein
MFTVTDEARELLRQQLDGVGIAAGLVVRVALDGEGLIMDLDELKPGDRKFQHEGNAVLVLDEATFAGLEDNTLHVEQTPDGPVLAFV